MDYPFKYLKAIGYDPYKGAEDYYYDAEEGDKVIAFLKNELKFTKDKWKGEPFLPYPEQEDRIRCLFGWKRKSDGQRRYRMMFLYIPRKNGKSEEAAAVANYCFFCDKVNDAEIYIGARDRGQALTLYNMASGMIQQNDDLLDEVTTYATTKEIKANWDNSKIQAISGDALSQHSLSPSVGLIDELHAHQNGDLLAAIRTGMGGRQQPLLVIITTADIDRESVCNDELEYARAIRDGKVKNPRYLPVIYETLKDADWKDEAVWKAVNPNYPNTPNRDFMIEQSMLAEKSNRVLSEFKRYNLNMITSSVEGWLNMDFWRLGNKDFKESELDGEDCYVVFDLSSKLDLNAQILFFPEKKRVICRFYCPKDAISRDKSGHYNEWIEGGYLIEAGKERADYQAIINDLLEFKNKFNIKGIGYDPYNANMFISMIEEHFEDEIEEGEEDKESPSFLQEFTQTYKNYNEPAKEFEAMIIENDIFHNSPVLDWMAANVVIVEQGHSGNIMPKKPTRNSPLKIDGIVALVMAIGLWMSARENEEESPYEKRGMIVL